VEQLGLRTSRRSGKKLLASAFSALAFERIAGYGLPIDEAFVVRVVDGLLLPACAIRAD
jgi:hypothetical protein